MVCWLFFIHKSFRFTLFFGKDTDALLDCLNETMEEQKVGYMLWLKELHSGEPSLTEDVATVLGVLQEAVNHAKDKNKTLIYCRTCR